MSSPTSRTIAYVKERGGVACIVEKFNAHTKRRIDAFGFGDVLACFPDDQQVVLIQTTTGGDLSRRKTKILEECREKAMAWLASGGGIELHGWKKYKKPVNGRYWRVRHEDLRLEDFR